MENRTKQKMEMQRKQCHQIFHTEKELIRHKQYTCETITTTNNDVTIKDQRRQPQEQTPQTIQWQKNKIRYDPEQQRWICQLCRKQYGPQSMRNAILHASAHTNTRHATEQNKWKSGCEIHEYGHSKNKIHMENAQKQNKT